LYLSRFETAELLRVSVRTVDRLPLPKVKIGGRTVLPRDAVDAYIKARTVDPAVNVEPVLGNVVAFSTYHGNEKKGDDWLKSKLAALNDNKGEQKTVA
jgi:hypothetical protein